MKLLRGRMETRQIKPCLSVWTDKRRLLATIIIEVRIPQFFDILNRTFQPLNSFTSRFRYRQEVVTTDPCLLKGQSVSDVWLRIKVSNVSLQSYEAR